MSKRKGYRFARFAPFPHGALGVGVMRNHNGFSAKAPYSTAMVTVFMPPMDGVTINVTTKNVGRFQVNTDGLIPVLTHDLEDSTHFLFLADRDKQLAPFSIANVYDNGEICWGPSGKPLSMRSAWEEFFTRPFNCDLTPIGRGEEHDADGDRQSIIANARREWIEERVAIKYPREHRVLTKICSTPPDYKVIGDGYTRNIEMFLRPNNNNPNGVSAITGRGPCWVDDYWWFEGTTQPHEIADHPVYVEHFRHRWSPSSVVDMMRKVREVKQRVEIRRRGAAAAEGKMWSAFAAHDTTWMAMLKFERMIAARASMVGTGSYGPITGLPSSGWRDTAQSRARQVISNERTALEDSLSYYAGEAYLSIVESGKFTAKRGYDGNLYRQNIVENSRQLAEALSKKWPRWIRRYIKRIVHLFTISFFRAQLEYRLRDYVNARCGSEFDRLFANGEIVIPELEEYDRRANSDGFGHGLTGNIRRHFSGGWKKTLVFGEFSDHIGPINKHEFVPGDRFDGLAYVPSFVYYAANPTFGESMKSSEGKLGSSLNTINGLSARFFTSVLDGEAKSRMHTPTYEYLCGLYKRYRSTSVAIVQMYWCDDDALYLYDGRYRMVRIPSDATPELVDKMANELDTTELWGLGWSTSVPGVPDLKEVVDSVEAINRPASVA